MNEKGNDRQFCADVVPSQARLESLLRVPSEQWPNKSPEDREHERRFIERDYAALTGCRVAVKS